MAQEQEALANLSPFLFPEIRNILIDRWPDNIPFTMDRFTPIPIYPLGASGYQNELLKDVSDKYELRDALKEIDKMPQIPSKLIEELILISHQYDMPGGLFDPFGTHDILNKFRARDAYLKLKEAVTPNYHDIAYLYYALMFGSSTLGGKYNNKTIAEALRYVKNRQIYSPRILILGFASIYCLENIGALLYLVGFKNADIVGLDLSCAPIKQGRQYFGDRIFGYPIEYLQGDGRALPFKDNVFDMIATNRLLHHLNEYGKYNLLKSIRRVLKPGAEFVDEEAIVEGEINLDDYYKSYRELAGNFGGSDEERAEVADYLENFPRFPHRFFKSAVELRETLEQSGLRIDLSWSHDGQTFASINLIGSCVHFEGKIDYDFYQIRARKV